MTLAIERLSERAWIVHLGDRVDAATNARVHRLRRALLEARLPGLEDMVPAYASLLLRGSPVVLDALDDGDARALPIAWRGTIDALADELQAGDGSAQEEQGRLHRLPVCYGGKHGEDLSAVAERLDMSPDDVVARHSAAEYSVAMLGFAPGFAYLLGLDPTLQVPRRDRPRTRVPAGSIGLAGAQTGVYPSVLPGGWQLIGRTPCRLIDLDDSERPCRLMPGDRVRFEPINARRFAELAGEGA